MGCDIHAFLEIEQGPGLPYEALFSGRMKLPRVYAVFSALAGVRSLEPPRFPPRGIPTDLSERVFEHYYMGVVDDPDLPHYRGFQFVSLSEAEGRERLPPEIKPSGVLAPHGWIVAPDWHTPSWLLLPEILEALHDAKLSLDMLPPEYSLLQDVMSVAAHRLGRAVRLVFWFDN